MKTLYQFQLIAWNLPQGYEMLQLSEDVWSRGIRILVRVPDTLNALYRRIPFPKSLEPQSIPSLIKVQANKYWIIFQNSRLICTVDAMACASFIVQKPVMNGVYQGNFLLIKSRAPLSNIYMVHGWSWYGLLRVIRRWSYSSSHWKVPFYICLSFGSEKGAVPGDVEM